MKSRIDIEIQKVQEKNYEIKFNIEPLASFLNISKDRCAELLADALMNGLGIK